MERSAATGALWRPWRDAWVRLARGLLWALWCPALLAAGPEPARQTFADPPDTGLRASLAHAAARTVLPARCSECHAAEFDVWRTTGHAAGFDTLHRTDRAKEIAGKLGLRLIRRGTDVATPACLGCHYTPVVRRGRLRAAAGVSCESCHGPARDWVSVHSSYGVPAADFQEAARLETAAHRDKRIADSAAAGMRRSAQVYELAAACFGCHTVPSEEIVNRGGHTTGSNDFELVEWSGRIRHNFLESYRTGDGRTNAERSRASKRVLYVVGRMLAVEFALRGVASATTDDLYFAALRDRAEAAPDELLAIHEQVAIPEVRTAIEIAGAAALRWGDRTLPAAADAVRAATKAFVARADGASLTALDRLWDPDQKEAAPPLPRLTDAGVRTDGVPFVDEDAGSAGDAPDLSPAPAADRSLLPARSAPPEAVPLPVPAVPHTRPPWREPSTHDFVGVPCAGCHPAQERWWRGHPHSRAAARLRNRRGRVLEIARAYGVAAGDVDRGTRICMWCHGTITSRPSRRVRAGVGCQRCHGAGADYVEAHQTGSHSESVALGLTELRDPAVQAATCAGCHYITDPGLIDAGHSTGADFDIISRKAGIVHWGEAFDRPTVPVDPVALRTAHARVRAARGPVPDRRVAVAAGRVDAHRPGVESGAGKAVVSDASGEAAGATAASAPVRPATAAPRGRAAPETSRGSGDAAVATTLDVLRQHLDALARALGLSSAP